MEETILESTLIVIAVPTAFIRSTCLEIKKYLKKGQHICIASKGIEQNTCNFGYDIVYDILKTRNIGVISGPSFAIDVINKVPIGLALGCKNKNTEVIIKKTFENNHFKLRTTSDILGIEVCGAFKNVIAIAAGMIDGMNLPISTKAFLITEALNDVKELIKALGGNKKTILSFAGFGDILLTCTSEKSRNYSFGVLIGKNKTNKELESYLNKNTVEGVYTLKSIYKLTKRKKIKIPIIDLIYNIVFNQKHPNELLNFLIKK